MYCINCGVKLADSEEHCPLCGIRAYHPEILREEAEPMYPHHQYPGPQVSSRAAQIILTTMALMAQLITLLCDLQINAAVTWSGYVIGAVLVGYSVVVLPFWFRKPNPVVFVPIVFVTVGLYLLYINLATGGSWFLGFAFPVTAYIGFVTTTVVALLKYLRRGRLYIFGGSNIAMGLFMPVMEFLIYITFDRTGFAGWSLYPLIAMVLIGCMLIFLAICRPARQTMERKFFI